MDWQTVLNIAISIGGVAGPFVIKLLLDKINQAKLDAMTLAEEAKRIGLDSLRRHNEFELKVTRDYVSMAHFDKFEERLFSDLEIIKNKLDNKADKP